VTDETDRQTDSTTENHVVQYMTRLNRLHCKKWK